MGNNKKLVNPKEKRIILMSCITILVLAIFGGLVVFRNSNLKKASVESQNNSETQEEALYTIIETPYMNLQFPDELKEHIVHEQEEHAGVITEVFYMLTGDTKTSLYRIDFGDETAGDWLGVLSTDEGEIPITYTVFVIDEEELTALGEGAVDTYNALMNGFNVILESIYADSRFKAEKEISVGEDQEAKLTYWTVTLPGDMSWVEETVEGNYQAIFYGAIQGERVALYTVRIGDIEAETVLGNYKIDDVEKTISVESYDLNQYTNWTDDDFEAAYRMMDTINLVIEQIMASEHFLIPMEETPEDMENAQ